MAPRRSARHAVTPPIAAFKCTTVKRRIAKNNITSRFGHRLQTLRVNADMTQLEMAKKFGISRGFISDVERGEHPPSLPMLEVFALGLRITLSELLKDL